MIEMIWSEDLNGAIGYKGKLLHPFKEDMARFREVTKGATLLIGRKTYESIPIQVNQVTPLPDRYKLVLTGNPHTESSFHDVEYVSNLDLCLKEHDYFKHKRLVVIGGAEIYQLLLPFTEFIHLTGVMKMAKDYDAVAPTIGDEFQLVSKEHLAYYATYHLYKRVQNHHPACKVE
jgi:dihydrofolate reductase